MTKPTDARKITAEEARGAAGFLARNRDGVFADAGAYDMILAFIDAAEARAERGRAEATNYILATAAAAYEACRLTALEVAHKYELDGESYEAAEDAAVKIAHLAPIDAKATVDEMLARAKAEALVQYHDKTNALLAKRKEEIHQARVDGRAEAHEQHEGTYAKLRSDERDGVRVEGHAAGIADERKRCLAKIVELRERRTMDRIIEANASFSPQAQTRGFLLALDHVESRIATTEIPTKQGEE